MNERKKRLLWNTVYTVNYVNQLRTDDFDGEPFLCRSPLIAGADLVFAGILAGHSFDHQTGGRLADVQDDVRPGPQLGVVLVPRDTRRGFSLHADADLCRAAGVRVQRPETVVKQQLWRLCAEYDSNGIVIKRNVKSFPSQWAARIPVCLARHQFTLPYHGHGTSASRGAPNLLPSFHWYSLRLPTGGRPGWVWLGWLDTCRDGLSACWRSPIQVLTEPVVD